MSASLQNATAARSGKGHRDENFPVASHLIHPRHRGAILTFYDFVRTYSFLSSVLTYSNADWERLSIFLNFLTPRLPAPKEEDLSKGILETIDMDSYRVEMRAQMAIALPDQDAEIGRED